MYMQLGGGFAVQFYPPCSFRATLCQDWLSVGGASYLATLLTETPLSYDYLRKMKLVYSCKCAENIAT